LRGIAQKVPSEGVIFTSNSQPQMSINVNLPVFSAGIDFGLDVYERFSISKDLFDFFGYGNELGEEVDIAFYNYTDVYWYINTKLAMELKDYKLKVMPSLFIPLMSSAGTAGSFTVTNDETGRLFIDLKTDMSYYTNFSVDDYMTALDTQLFQCAGVDISAELEFPVNEAADLRIAGRVPVIPGKLNQITYVQGEYIIDTKVMDASEAELQSTDLVSATIDAEYSINRPIKANAYYTIKPMGSFLYFVIGAGLGVYHPFLDSMHIYPEYFLGVNFSMADIIKLSVSTEYTEQVFKHQLTSGFSVRFVELNLGVSFQSASMTKSFSGSGMGGFVTVSYGF